MRDTRTELFGAPCRERAVGVGSAMPRAEIEAMNLHAAEIVDTAPPGDHAVRVLDGGPAPLVDEAGRRLPPSTRGGGAVDLPASPILSPFDRDTPAHRGVDRGCGRPSDPLQGVRRDRASGRRSGPNTMKDDLAR